MSIFDDSFSETPVSKRRGSRPRYGLWAGIIVGVIAAAAILIALLPKENTELASGADENPSDVNEVIDNEIESSEPVEGNGDPIQDQSSGSNDLYSSPADLGSLIEKIHASTVTIYCDDIQGSGWALELGDFEGEQSQEERELAQEFPYEVVTNHHVIEPCIDNPSLLEAQVQDVVLDAYLYSWDIDNDLALVAIKQNVPALETSSTPQPGWWAMAVGTPYGLEGSIALGNVMNTDSTDVVSTAPLNGGMSGGPLVNSRGEVMGTNTWFYADEEIQDWNVAVGLPALCDVLVDCEGSDYWND